MKYYSKPVQIEVDGKRVFVRATAPFAYIPNVGKVSLPDYLQQQATLQAQAKKLKGVEAAQAAASLTLPNLLARYTDHGGTSQLFLLSDKDDFPPENVEEATAGVEALKARIAELEAKLQPSTETE